MLYQVHLAMNGIWTHNMHIAIEYRWKRILVVERMGDSGNFDKA
jgi:hypothetical protein